MPDPVIQQLPFPVRVIRWWQSIVLWIQVWSFIELALPILLLTDFSTLGFSPKMAAWAVIIVKLLNVGATLVQRNRSNSVIGNRQDKAVADNAPAVPSPAPPPHNP